MACKKDPFSCNVFGNIKPSHLRLKEDSDLTHSPISSILHTNCVPNLILLLLINHLRTDLSRIHPSNNHNDRCQSYRGGGGASPSTGKQGVDDRAVARTTSRSDKVWTSRSTTVEFAIGRLSGSKALYLALKQVGGSGSEFSDCISQCGLIDIPVAGSKFTWSGVRSNGRLWSRSDRSLFNEKN
ncbi:unnamed protein product [Cuscuta epithymum]|uniref:Uncharacterized protein n=1 Tax=Cuscuta epithymum TaxID=186058 RepID=A0AAV0CU55_9ASTE|nr:unnamed protein product [Cuscuta epithymum]